MIVGKAIEAPLSIRMRGDSLGHYQAMEKEIAKAKIAPATKAYFDYVTHPDHATHIPQAIEDPRIIVARTPAQAVAWCSPAAATSTSPATT